MKLKGICSLEEKYDQPRQHIKKRVSTLPTKVCKVKARVFPVVMYKCEKWTIKKVEIEEQMRSNYDAGEDSLEFLGLRGDQISQS